MPKKITLFVFAVLIASWLLTTLCPNWVEEQRQKEQRQEALEEVQNR